MSNFQRLNFIILEISKGYILPWWKDISAADQYSHNKERTVAESRIEAKSATAP